MLTLRQCSFMQIFLLLAQLVPMSLQAPTLPPLTLKEGGAKDGLEQNMLRGVPLCQPATQKDLVPDDLYVAGPPPGHLNRYFNGYLKMEIARENLAPDRIPNVLHRIIFLGSMPLISEKELMELMDTTMLRAYEGWKDANQQSGFRFELYNLERAEAYIKEHFQEQVLTAFRILQPNAYKSDMFRYLLLYQQGGWYVDLKVGLSEALVSLNDLLCLLASELKMPPESVSFVATGQNMVWNVPGAEGVMNAFLGAKPRHAAFGDTIVRVVDEITGGNKGATPWSLTGPYALFAGLGKRKNDAKQWQTFNAKEGVALLRFGFDEWHLPVSDRLVLTKASRGECGGGWAKIGGNNYVDMWFADAVFKPMP